MPAGSVQLSAVERKIQSKTGTGAGVKRAKSFGSTSAPTSPSVLRRNKQPTVEPRYTKSTYLLIEAKRIARELEEKKKSGSLLVRPQSAKTINLGSRARSGSGGIASQAKGVKRAVTTESAFRRSESPIRTNIRRRAKSQYCRVPPSEQEEGNSKVDLDVSRLNPLRNSGRKRNFVVSSTVAVKSCDECDKTLKSGFYSEHNGLSYCNVPCYTSLFSSMLSRADDSSTCSTLSEEQKQFRGSLIPKLRTYNAYYGDKPCQISCKEMNDKFVLEGIIKVYWGLHSPVTLTDSDVSHYWQHFHPDDGNKRNENSENVPPNTEKTKKPSLSAIRRARNALQGNQNKYKYKRKESGEGPRKRSGCVACNHESLNGFEGNSTFVPPYGTPTTLRITNHVTAPLVIDMLLKKFQIKDNRKRFSLFTVYESGGQRRMINDSYPLLTRLSLGPCEDVAKIFIMDRADQMDIPLEVAQYINFSTQVLETFVQKFHEEEEREIERIKEKYQDYKEMILKRMEEYERNNRFPKEE
ncbi:ras association domain-containing protein 4-like isoform X2 [Hydractinia symbiolongicarpus]|nr:ras association domain-containing protein 4-like isoform X2 [Hydractinia symbiolongicarpus]